MRLLLVTWRDAVSNHIGWASKADVEKQECAIARSVGWELKRTKTKLTLVSSLVDDEVGGDLTIPIGMIVREEELVKAGGKQ